MTKTISANLKTHLAGPVTTLATLWKLTRQDTTVFAFTDHDKDIVYGGTTYEAATGFLPTALDQSGALNVDNLDVMTFFDSAKITEADVVAGLFDYADIDIVLINYESTGDGIVYLAGGWKVGEFTLGDNGFTAEVRSKSQLLQQQILDLYSPDCRAEFCDAKCGLTAATYTETGTVTSVSGSYPKAVFTDTSRSEGSDVFGGGVLTWTSGNNDGIQMDVKEYNHSTKTFTLMLQMPVDIEIGDDYSVLKACDKTDGTCKNTYSNLDNFRGEPLLKGIDHVVALT